MDEFTGIIIEVEDVEAAAALSGGDFLRTWVDIASVKVVSDEHRDLLRRIRHELVDRLTFVELIEWFWSHKWLENDVEAEEINTWQELQEHCSRNTHPRTCTLHLYLQEMDLKSKAPSSITRFNPMSDRAWAKGLEFNTFS